MEDLSSKQNSKFKKQNQSKYINIKLRYTNIIKFQLRGHFFSNDFTKINDDNITKEDKRNYRINKNIFYMIRQNDH